MKFLILNGPNLNLLGQREPGVYGAESYESLCKTLERFAKDHGAEAGFFQSNHEGAILDAIHAAQGVYDAIIINPGAVIATGGGMVLREENMAALGKTGVIFFRDRPPEAIVGEDHKGRPLVGSDKAEARERIFRLYEERIALYKRYAHHTILPTDTYQEAAEQIAALFEKEVLAP